MVFSKWPGVAELADAADSKSAGALLCVGSTPSSGTLFLPRIITFPANRVSCPGAARANPFLPSVPWIDKPRMRY